MKKLFIALILTLAVILTGCDEKMSEIDIERLAREEALQREAEARQMAQREQAKREFWQGAAYTACATAVLFLVVGAAVGSRGRDAAAKP
jgi:hypothetical protein